MQPSAGSQAQDLILDVLRRPVETRDTEFKRSTPFEALKWKLLKTCLAMANLREGGRIIVGVAEEAGVPVLVGMDPTHEGGYTQDIVYSFVNRHARPRVDLRLRIVEFEGKRFVGIDVRSFVRVPVFCGVKTPPDAGDDGMRVGDIPGRTMERISTSKLYDADVVAEIIEVAVEKRVAEVIAMLMRAGAGQLGGSRKAEEDDDEQFARERREFGDF